ncbi:membrane protein insertion efficiency factor YidD [Halarcobacter sp.]|uniref:membrane protein insertion efficiency factor YidD n=1 Tax=Halarcobacter sp. TaxID=2321133 RepID=UPI002AA91130|nr:membrane protein insertion efficiency factor YidD [Halarcobacter sp.]
MKKVILFMINLYRKSGGSKRWFGIECNFEPTCSLFTYNAIEKYGIKKGITLGFHRINDCKKSDSICKCIDPLK